MFTKTVLKWLLSVSVLVMVMQNLMIFAEKRFSRPVIKVANSKEYGFFRLDDNNFPFLQSDQFSVSCMVYRGTRRYYVEVGIMNYAQQDLVLDNDLITFIKPNYTVLRTQAIDAALEVATDAGGNYVPVPPPHVPPSTTTTYSGTASTYGNQTYVSGTANTTPDNSGQAGANLGNAIGNAMAARSFYRMQSTERKFANFLYSFAQEHQNSPIKPRQARIIVSTFEQIKPKKAPFEVRIRLAGETFTFKYKE